MKNLLPVFKKSFFVLIFLFFCGNLLAKTVTSVNDGDWTDAATWDNGVPLAGDDVVIGLFTTVTISSTISTTLNSLTIGDVGELDVTDGGTFTTGSLEINGGTLYMKTTWTGTCSVTGDFVNSSDGTFILTGNGTVNMGDDVSDKFETDGAFSWRSSPINVAGYALLSGGTLSLYGSGLTLNIANADTRNDANANLYISPNFTLYYGSSSYSLDVVIKNCNIGTGKEADIEGFTVTGTAGSASIKFQNIAAATHDYEMMLGDGENLPTIDSDIGSANTLEFESESGTKISDTISSAILRSGSFNQSALIGLVVRNNFESNTSSDITIDGVLAINDTLFLNGNVNNVVGDGLVSATTFDIGTADVYGVQPSNGGKAAGSTWTGNSSTDWFDVANWGKKVPSQNTIVYISDDYTGTYKPIIDATGAESRQVELEGSGITLDVQSTGGLTVYETGNSGKDGELILNSGTALTVEDGGAVDVGIKTTIDGGLVTINPGGNFISDTIVNTTDANLVIQSSSSGSGSLICGGTPNATVQRYVDDNAWHLVTPVTDAVSTEDYYLGAPNRSWLAAFNESADNYYYITNADSSLSRGIGFSYWIGLDQGAQTIDYTGKLTGADVTVTLTKDSAGWNLIGNPFPSALDWSSVSAGNTTGTAYIWDNSQEGYLYSTTGAGEVPNPDIGTIPNDKIPMGQGFFVQAASAGSFTIPAAARVYSTDSFVKKKSAKVESNAPSQFIRIDIDGGYYGNTVFVGFPKYGTDGFDIPGDATKLFSSSNHIQFYVAHGGKALCIEANSPLSNDTTEIVPLDVIQATGKSYTMKFSDLDQLPGVSITLEDLKTGMKQNIRKDSVYTFTAFQNDIPNRFLLHFSRALTVSGVNNEVVTSSGIQIYSYGSKIYVRTSGKDVYKENVVFVYDLLGRKLLEKSIPDFGLTDLDIPVKDNYVVVKVVNDNQITTKKVFVE